MFRDPLLEDAYRAHSWQDQMRSLRRVCLVTLLLIPLTVVQYTVGGFDVLFLAAVANRGLLVAAAVWMWGASLREPAGPAMERRTWTMFLVLAVGVGILAVVRDEVPFANLLAVSTFVLFAYLGPPMRLHLAAIPAVLVSVIWAPSVLWSLDNRFQQLLVAAFLPVAHLLGAGTKLRVQRVERRLFGRLNEEQRMRVALEAEVERRRQMQEDLQNAMAAAESANRSKTLFLATMSHEIRTPLNGILGLSELLLLDELPEHTHDSLDAIRASAGALSGLLTEVLDLSRIDAEGLSLRPEVFSASQLASDAVAIVESSGRAKGLEVRLAATPPDIWVDGDLGRLRQVLLNLLGNAVKFTESGSVTLTLKADVQGDWTVLRFEVRDTGVGISAEQLPFVFERFQQADAGHTRGRSGAGLGLAISRSIMEQMGGALTASSVLGEGSCFRLSVQLPSAARRVEVQAPRAEALRGLSVLVVDDDPINRMVVLGMLERLGHVGTARSSGDEALAWLAGERPDVVLMDVQMPGMSGIECTRRIRERGLGLTVIALTANAMPEDREACLQAGMDAYLSKPVTLSELGEALDRALVVV